MLRSRVVLPVASLYAAWQAMGLPALHRALIAEIDFDGDAIAEGDLDGGVAVFRDAWAALERQGLACGRTVHSDLGRTLRLVAEAGTEYYAFFNHDDEDTRSALVVVSGDEALRVVLTEDRQFVLEPVLARDAPQALVAALPQAPPGKGPAISLPADALDPQPRDHDDHDRSFLRANRPVSTPHQQQIDALRALLREPRIGGGQLFASRQDRFGKKVRAPRPLTFFDTDGGRYLQFQAPGTNGQPWNTVRPADFTAMADRLVSMSPWR